MNYTINNDERLLVLEEGGIFREIPLYSPQAYETLSREWMRVRWALCDYYTFTWAGQPLLQLPEDVVRLKAFVSCHGDSGFRSFARACDERTGSVCAACDTRLMYRGGRWHHARPHRCSRR